MTSMYDVLKASKGIYVDDTFAELWGRKLSNAYTVATYTGTFPAVLQTVAGYLESYKIYGNTVQNGTPTPENPIMPSGCGELETTGVNAGQYKLPLSSAGQDVDIYLGEVQTTRRIKKLVLKGTSMDGNSSVTAQGVIFITPMPTLKSVGAAYCTHFKYVNQEQGSGMPDNSFTTSGGAGRSLWFKTNYASVDDFRSYLAAQYAAGTPVTVWYVLANPNTGTLNEPLRKIGDYADTIDSTQTSAQIPTAAGSTTISWAGEGLAPSEVELTYRKPKGQ